MKTIAKFILITGAFFASIVATKGQTKTGNGHSTMQKSLQSKFLDVLNYPFKDSLNRTVRASDFKGKFIMIDLWYSGCGACISANEGLKTVHDSLKKENVVFLSISTDKDKEMWLQSVTKNAPKTKKNPWAGKYTPAKGTVILYTGGSGEENEFCRQYVPTGAFPQLLLIGPNGQVISNNPPRPDSDPTLLINYIRKML